MFEINQGLKAQRTSNITSLWGKFEANQKCCGLEEKYILKLKD